MAFYQEFDEFDISTEKGRERYVDDGSMSPEEVAFLEGYYSED